METVFLKLLNMSIAAGWLVLAVIVLRVILKKAPKAFRCFLWALVGIRLVCPFSFESVFSLIPSVETVPEDIMYAMILTVPLFWAFSEQEFIYRLPWKRNKSLM